MIKVRVSSRAGFFRSLRISGHARLSAPGTDVLCAAVSTLAENLGAGLRLLLNVRIRVAAEEGFYEVELLDEKNREQAELLFASATLGLRALAEQYPDRIVFEAEDPKEEQPPGE